MRHVHISRAHIQSRLVASTGRREIAYSDNTQPDQREPSKLELLHNLNTSSHEPTIFCSGVIHAAINQEIWARAKQTTHTAVSNRHFMLRIRAQQLNTKESILWDS